MNHPSSEAVSAGGFITSRQFALVTLLAANAVAIAFFLAGDNSVIQVLWIYWLQSVIIGLVNVVRIARLPLGDLQIQGMSNEASNRFGIAIKGFLATFFTLHYGGFHFGYMLFLIVLGTETTFTVGSSVSQMNLNESGVAVGAVLLSGLVFAVHHTLTYVREQQEMHHGQHAQANAFTALFRPYARIIPMHLTIILGPLLALKFGTDGMFVLFMILKTAIDVMLFRRWTRPPVPAKTVATT
jgi:hypothetical protein